jgi:hypothetical protein
MAAMRPDGQAVEIPMGQPKARGRNLSSERAIRIRDLLIVLLVRGVGLSIPDVVAVLSVGNINRSQVYDRLSRCPVNLKDVITTLRAEASDGAQTRVG